MNQEKGTGEKQNDEKYDRENVEKVPGEWESPGMMPHVSTFFFQVNHIAAGVVVVTEVDGPWLEHCSNDMDGV